GRRVKRPPPPQKAVETQVAEATLLVPGKPVEGEMAGGQKRSYQVSLLEGQCARVVVEQRGIDVVVRWLAPDGKQVVDFDSESRLQGEEKSEFVARASGSYGLVVEARQQKAAAGRYAVRFDDLHTATEKETDLPEARIAYADSVRFRRAGKYDEAQAANQRALDIREKWLGSDSLELAAPLNNLAFVYRDKAAYAKAEQLFRRALD